MPLPGDKMRIKYQAPLDRSDLFVRAVLRDPDDILLGSSPVSLTYVGQGLYTNNALIFPDVSEIKITLEVFKDAAFTQSFKSRFSNVIQTIERSAEQQTTLAGVTIGPLVAKVMTDQSKVDLIDDLPFQADIRDDEAETSTQDDQSKTNQQDDQLTARSN